jgi:GTP-binding protein
VTVPRIAVVGRQNVGKSTLVNRLFGRREAIAHGDPGVTRDRLEVEATWNGRRFGLVDTAGTLHRARGVEAVAAKQTERALEQAQLVLLVVDVRSGITEEDARLARRLRRVDVPVVLVANKVDGPGDEPEAAPFHALGLGEPVAVSAQHGRRVGELLDRLVELLPEAPEAIDEEDEEPRFALVGRPNVGKSSLFNRLVGDERSVVFEEAGTTRDSVDAVIERPDGRRIRFVDTAGMRRRIRTRGVEYYGLLRTDEAIERAHAAAVVFDASEGLTAEDRKIAYGVLEAGRALLLVANKWDLVEERDRRFKELTEESRSMAGATVVRTSAVTGLGAERVPELLLDVHERWSRRVPTSSVNRVLEEAQAVRPLPRGVGPLRYATQVGTGPPTFVLFGGSRPPDPGSRRFLENRLRAAFELGGVPIVLRIRPRRPRGPGEGTRRRPMGR